MPRLLVIDTESGGLDPLQHSILSLGGVVWEDGLLIGEREVFILETPLFVTPQAMAVNRIDLDSHAQRAKNPYDSLFNFVEFLKHHFDIDTDFK